MQSSNHHPLDQLCARMTDALAAEDWEQLQQLDIACRQALEVFGNQEELAGRLGEQPDLAQSLIELQQCYQQLVSRCGEHRDRLRAELTVVNKSRRASKAYTQK